MSQTPFDDPEEERALFQQKAEKEIKLKRLNISKSVLLLVLGGMGAVVVAGTAYYFTCSLHACHGPYSDEFRPFLELIFSALVSIATLLIGFIAGSREY